MGKTASDPVYGETKPHKTDMGAKAESTWHKAKANMPGTKEHRMMKEGNEGEGRYDNVRDEADRAAMGYERRHGQETAGGDWGQDRARGTAGVSGVGAAGGYNTMGDRGYEGAAGGAGGFGTSEAGYHKHGTTGASAGYGSQPSGYSTERRTHDEHEDKGIMGQMMDKVKSVMPGAKTDEEKRVQEHSGRGAEGGSMGLVDSVLQLLKQLVIHNKYPSSRVGGGF